MRVACVEVQVWGVHERLKEGLKFARLANVATGRELEKSSFQRLAAPPMPNSDIPGVLGGRGRRTSTIIGSKETGGPELVWGELDRGSGGREQREGLGNIVKGVGLGVGGGCAG